MKTEKFDFNADSRVMPHGPVELRGKNRDSGRMIVLEDRTYDIYEYLRLFRPGNFLVLNDNQILSGTTIVEIKSEQLTAKPGLVLTSIDNHWLTCSLIEPQPGWLWMARFEPNELLVPTLDQ